MKRTFRYILTAAVCCLFAAHNAPAQYPAAQKQTAGCADAMAVFKESLKENVAIKAIDSRFTYIRSVSVFASDEVKKGSFSFRRGGGIAMEFDDGDYIRINGDSFEMKSGENVSRSRSNPMVKEINRMLAACLSGDVDALLGGFKADLADNSEEYLLTLTPKSRRGGAMFSSLELCFNRGDMTLSSMKMSENNGDSSTYRFTNQKITR